MKLYILGVQVVMSMSLLAVSQQSPLMFSGAKKGHLCVALPTMNPVLADQIAELILFTKIQQVQMGQYSMIAQKIQQEDMPVITTSFASTINQIYSLSKQKSIAFIKNEIAFAKEVMAVMGAVCKAQGLAANTLELIDTNHPQYCQACMEAIIECCMHAKEQGTSLGLLPNVLEESAA